MTNGEYRVGIDFNPSANDHVNKIKRMAADLIDLIDDIRAPDWDNDTEAEHMFEIHRLQSLAMTAIEDGAMWAVKAATKGKP